MRISDWSSDVSLPIYRPEHATPAHAGAVHPRVCGEQTWHKWLSHKAICAVDKFTNIARPLAPAAQCDESWLSKSCFVVYLFDSGSAASGKNSTSVTPSNSVGTRRFLPAVSNRSEEHTSELQSLMRTSYAVFCLQ